MEEGKHTSTPDFDVYEKMDGSLIIIFWYDGGWVVASRGSFTSEQAVGASKIFFDELDHNFSIGITYLFEFTAPWNRIVVDYGEKPNLTLLGAIRTETGEEASWEILKGIAEGANCDVVKKYDSIADYSTLKGMVGNNEEGFVIRFSNGDRMKIKGEEYLRLHKIMTEVSTKSVWEILSNGDNMEGLLNDVPDEFYKKIKEYEISLINEFIEIRDDAISKCASIAVRVPDNDRKSFAELAKEYQYPNLLFLLLEGRDVSQAIWKIIQPEFRKL